MYSLHQADTKLWSHSTPRPGQFWSVMEARLSRGPIRNGCAFLVCQVSRFWSVFPAATSRPWLDQRLHTTSRTASLPALLSTGPDSRRLIDPVKRHRLASRSGPTRPTSTCRCDHGKSGGAPRVGCFFLVFPPTIPALTRRLRATGKSLDLDSCATSGDNRWSMSIWAATLDTGVRSNGFTIYAARGGTSMVRHE